MPRPEKHIGPDREIAVVLPVHQQQVDAAWRRLLVHHRSQDQQDGGAGPAVVGAGHRPGAVGGVIRLVGIRPRVPVGEQQQRPRGLGAEARQEIDQRDGVALRRHVGESLHDQRVGSCGQVLLQPRSHRPVACATRYARSEFHLPTDERVGRRSVEVRVADGRRRGIAVGLAFGAAAARQREEHNGQ